MNMLEMTDDLSVTQAGHAADHDSQLQHIGRSVNVLPAVAQAVNLFELIVTAGLSCTKQLVLLPADYEIRITIFWYQLEVTVSEAVPAAVRMRIPGLGHEPEGEERYSLLWTPFSCFHLLHHLSHVDPEVHVLDHESSRASSSKVEKLRTSNSIIPDPRFKCSMLKEDIVPGPGDDGEWTVGWDDGGDGIVTQAVCYMSVFTEETNANVRKAGDSLSPVKPSSRPGIIWRHWTGK